MKFVKVKKDVDVMWSKELYDDVSNRQQLQAVAT